MSLYCTVCGNHVPQGLNQCLPCNAGYAPQLACLICRRPVPRGTAGCSTCERRPIPAAASVELAYVPPQQPIPSLYMVPLPAAPPALPGLPAHVTAMSPIAERYSAGRFGVEAEVHVNPGDVDIMTLMGQVVIVLHTLAEKMNHFQGISESTRLVIRECRVLATELQDEIEVRRGPQG